MKIRFFFDGYKAIKENDSKRFSLNSLECEREKWNHWKSSSSFGRKGIFQWRYGEEFWLTLLAMISDVVFLHHVRRLKRVKLLSLDKARIHKSFAINFNAIDCVYDLQEFFFLPPSFVVFLILLWPSNACTFFPPIHSSICYDFDVFFRSGDRKIT